MKKIYVLYLSTKYSSIDSLKKFVNNYKKYKSGIKHQLIVCFKNLDSKELIVRKKILSQINYYGYIDPSLKNDHEFGSIKRVSKKFNSGIIFYMNDSSYPIKNNWLNIITSIYKRNTIIGCSASMSSWATNSYFRKLGDNYIVYLYKLIYFNLFVPKFPNPHLRFNGLLFHSSDYLKFIKKKIVKTRMNAYVLESGYQGFTNFFKSKKYRIFVVNSDGKIFKEKDWKISNTYSYKNQDKLLISDHNTRNYLKLNKKKKIKEQIKTWGNIS